MKKAIERIKYLFGLIPGIFIMITNLGVPPGQSKLLFGGLIEIFGAMTLWLLVIKKNKLKTLLESRHFNYSFLFAILSILFIVSYFFINSYFVKGKENHYVIYPIVITSDSLKNEIARYKYEGLIDEYGRDEVEKFINDEEPFYASLTEIIFFLNYLFIFISIVITFGFYGITLEDDFVKKKKGKD